MISKPRNDLPLSEPYCDVSWEETLLNLARSLDFVKTGKETQNKEVFIKNADEWLQYTRRIRYIISFEPYKSKLQYGDITKLFHIMFFAYLGVYGFIPQGTSEPVSLKTYLKWFVLNRFNINKVEEVPRYTMYDTDISAAQYQMAIAFMVIENPYTLEGDYRHLQFFDYDLFKEGSVFLGIASEGMYSLFAELMTFLVRFNIENDISSDKLIELINSQLGLANIAINNLTHENIVTLSENVKDRIRHIAKNSSGSNLIILIDEVLTKDGGGTFSLILEGLKDQFGDELMSKIEMYIGDEYTISYVVSKSNFENKIHQWKTIGNNPYRLIPREGTKPIRYKDPNFNPRA